MPVMKTPRHTFFNTRTNKIEREIPVASKVVDGKTIELWEIDFGGLWYIEVDGKDFDNGRASENFEEVKAKFEAI